MMMKVEDYSDKDLIEELKERGYAVYKGKEMQFCIIQLERMQSKMGGVLASNKKEVNKHGIQYYT